MTTYNESVVEQAKATVDAAIEAVLTAPPNRAVVGAAPAGAGKSYAIGTAVQAARRAGLRVAVATPTNDQAFSLVSALADRMPKEKITFIPASSVELPVDSRRGNVIERKARDANSDKILVGTLNKLGDAHAREDLTPVDILLIDEAYQANSVHYYLVGDLAPRHLLMGDSGQLAPFTTAPEADRWRGLREDPLMTAVEVVRRNHPSTPVHRLPITRRLDPRAVPVASAFYPDHPFDAAVLPGVRHLRLQAAAGGRANAVEDAALERAATAGWAHVELPSGAVITADPATASLLVRLAARLFRRTPKVQCENGQKARDLQPFDVAIVVSHNDQKDLLRAELSAARLEGIRVDTANKLQGLTFEVILAWHPLAGLMDVDEFHLDPGRLCVMLTRHRHACIVVGRAADRELVQGIPPATPSYVGWDMNPSLDGWYVHEAVFRRLEAHRIKAS
ncbi:AAA family ATPase [Chondromyces crocatus]|uniref:Helicase n=1 Tax=Chondromyces crocatus TaxID=52 RepID=A0A0K1EB95_CHOCO|nr:AAA family ATPase [Chondromyces crocatus]AKT38130.1 helicase [Chondromyces crocatus]